MDEYWPWLLSIPLFKQQHASIVIKDCFYMDDDGQHLGAHKWLLLLLLCDNMWWFNQLTYLQVMFGIKNNSQNKPYVSIDIY
jgi:hypothetical protein